MPSPVTIYTFEDGASRVVVGDHEPPALNAGNGSHVARTFESALHAMNMLPAEHSAMPVLHRMTRSCAECE